MKRILFVSAILIFAYFTQTANAAEDLPGPAEVPRISAEQLTIRLADPDMAIIDVRSPMIGKTVMS